MSSLGCFQIMVLFYSFVLLSVESRNDGAKGTRWAVLIAGSNGYKNYRHQADICHAYQILRKGGLKDENIIVFMYDDIALHPDNPRRGVIINRPNGDDVYKGVPKDYTGEAVNVTNFFNVLLGNKSGIRGGSGKVVKSGPNDHIFIYYADHGSTRSLSMPVGEKLRAKNFIQVLEKMHTLKRYNKMVIYVSACKSGSMFEGLLQKNLNILAMTSANPTEPSFACYCAKTDPPAPPEYNTCLGDLFSVSWLEHSEDHDMSKVTLEMQYQVVKTRVARKGTHVSIYGSEELLKDYLVSYIGTNPENDGRTPSHRINSRDIPLLYLQKKVDKLFQLLNKLAPLI